MASSLKTYAHALTLARSNRRILVKGKPSNYLDVVVGKDGSKSFVLSIDGTQQRAEIPQGGSVRDTADQLVEMLAARSACTPADMSVDEPKAARVEVTLTAVGGKARK